MTYSCCDFTDDIIEALGAHIPARCADTPSDQADICLEHITHLRESNKAMLAALKWAVPIFRPDTDLRKDMDAAIKFFETPPERWPDKEDAA